MTTRRQTDLADTPYEESLYQSLLEVLRVHNCVLTDESSFSIKPHTCRTGSCKVLAGLSPVGAVATVLPCTSAQKYSSKAAAVNGNGRHGSHT